MKVHKVLRHTVTPYLLNGHFELCDGGRGVSSLEVQVAQVEVAVGVLGSQLQSSSVLWWPMKG